nr:unnamed protein product [Haemonchus contortus]
MRKHKPWKIKFDIGAASMYREPYYASPVAHYDPYYDYPSGYPHPYYPPSPYYPSPYICQLPMYEANNRMLCSKLALLLPDTKLWRLLLLDAIEKIIEIEEFKFIEDVHVLTNKIKGTV